MCLSPLVSCPDGKENPKSPELPGTDPGLSSILADLSVLLNVLTREAAHLTSVGQLTSVGHILQQPGLRLHHVPVAEEDESPEIPPVLPLHILNNVVTAQGTVGSLLNSPDPDVPANRQEGHLRRRQRCGKASAQLTSV